MAQQWEICETRYFDNRLRGERGHSIYAEVMSSQGNYVVAEPARYHDHSSIMCPRWCDRWPPMGDPGAQEALDGVIAELLGQGWDLVMPGGDGPGTWFVYRFRRPAPNYDDLPPGVLLYHNFRVALWGSTDDGEPEFGKTLKVVEKGARLKYLRTLHVGDKVTRLVQDKEGG
jgi:hypothetical protein